MANFTGTAGNDNLTGTAAADTFDVSQGGNDTVSGLAGADTFNFGAAFTAADRIDGGTGADTVNLNGDYSAGVVFQAATMLNVENLVLAAGHSYSLTTANQTVAAGAGLTVDGSALGSGDTLNFVGGKETDGHFTIIGGAGNDTLVAGRGNDTIDLTHGGTDNASGGDGNDLFSFGATFDTSDRVSGGAGSDTVALNGNYGEGNALTVSASMITNVEKITLAESGSDYELTFAVGSVAASATLTVDASATAAGHLININANAVRSGTVDMIGGAGDDNLVGGVTGGTLAGNDGNDFLQGQGVSTLDGGDGDDTLFLTGTGTVDGGAGDDGIRISNLDASDAIDGGAGNDTVVFFGNTTLAGELTNVEQVDMSELGLLTTTDAAVAAGQTLTVLLQGSSSFNGSAETDGSFHVDVGSNIHTTITGGAGDDIVEFQIPQTNSDTVVDGGGGYDTVVLNTPNDPNSVTENLVFTNVEEVDVLSGSKFILDNNDVGATGTLQAVVDAGTLNATAVTNGGIIVASVAAAAIADGGSGADTLTATGAQARLLGGTGNDTLVSSSVGQALMTGGAGADHLIANGTHPDRFIYIAASDSTSTGYDTVSHFNATAGTNFQFDVPGTISAVDAAVTSGTLSTASFDTDLATALDSTHLGAHHAVLFMPNAGTLAGDTFLVIDVNGTAGYQASQDLVILLDSATHLSSLSASDFG